MIKKILIGIVTAGMILITIPTVNAEDEIIPPAQCGIYGVLHLP